jgi:hypothetical protein
VTISLGTLAVGKEPLRDYQLEIVLGAGHRHIKETTLLLNLLGSASGDGMQPSTAEWIVDRIK